MREDRIVTSIAVFSGTGFVGGGASKHVNCRVFRGYVNARVSYYLQVMYHASM
jgi:hypothetical protein